MTSKEKENNINSLFAELYKQSQNLEYDRALKTTNKILGLSQDDDVALRSKVACFIHTNKFKDALQILNKHSHLPELEFEKAYCLYRENQVLEAQKVIDNIKDSDLKVKELRAQIYYRLEKYEECYSVYRDIIKNSTDEYEDEREANFAAVLVHLAYEGSQMLPSIRETSYELTYNAASLLLAETDENDKSNFSKAEKKLRLAEKMCREYSEEEGLTEDEIECELALIKIQLGYCLQLQGREKEAQSLYMETLKKKPDDIALVAVANNNLATLNKDQNVFDSKKRMKSATQEGLEHKLVTRQRKIIAYNQCLLSLYTNQGEQCQIQCNKLMNEYPDMKKDATIIKSIQLSREGKTTEAAKLLNEQAKGKDYLPMKLACIQLLLNNENRKEAIEVLENLEETEKSLPGIVSAIVTLYMASGNRAKASEVLKDAVNYYKKKKENAGNLGKLWRQAADFHLRGGEVKIAADSLEELLTANPTDMKTLAQLIIAYAQFDPIKAQSLSKRLPSINDLVESTDIDSLESSNWVIGTKVVRKKIEASPGKPVTDLLKTKKKRKRKGKLPKNYDPNIQPDPERWLPRHERSGFRKKRDRRNRDIAMKGTQGAATGASDQFDITKISTSKPSPNPRQAPAVEPSGPRQQQRKVQQKKKKKGGKW